MKKTVAVFFGGVSPEHDISIITALSAVIKPLELAGNYTVVPVYITKSGTWYSNDSFKNVATFQSGNIQEVCEKLKPVNLTFDGGLTITKPGLRPTKIKVDVAFPAMHGGNGEDGSLMGLFRMANVPFVGSDMEASVIAMDKVLAKQVVEAASIPVTKYECINRHSSLKDPKKALDSIEERLNYPMFVKPTHLGSSIGIGRVTNRSELDNAVEVAAYYDDKILIEEEVENLVEVTLPIMGNEVSEVALLERPLVGDDAVFDFETKYMNGGKKNGGAKQTGAQGYSELPAKLDKDLYDKAVETARAVYSAAGCQGMSRVDLLIDSKTRVVYFNEINPLPGSLYAHNWRKSGVSSIELVERLIVLAEERFAKQQKLATTFSSDFLRQF